MAETAGTKKIRVLQIIKSLGRGGAEMLLPETLRCHRKDQFEFHYIYFLPWKNALAEAIIEQGGILTCIRANNNVEIILRVRDVASYIRRHRIKLIHAHLPWAGIVAKLAGRLTGVPVVYTEHNKQERYHFLTRRMNLASIGLLSRIIPVSRDVEDSIRRFKPGLRVPLQVILNGVNTDRFKTGLFKRSLIRSQLQIPEDALVIGIVAVFRVQKRLDLWLENAQLVLSQVPDTHFIIVGDGPLKAELVLKRRHLNLEDRVHFVGTQTEVRPYLSTFDLFMMTSIFEGLPVAMLEAMACGCPVISTDAGGVKEVVRDGIDGLLCPVEHPLTLNELAVDLLRNESKRMQFASSSRQRIVDGFSMEKMVQTLERCYLEEAKISLHFDE